MKPKKVRLKHNHIWACASPDVGMIHCLNLDGLHRGSTLKKAPAKWKCNCEKCPPPDTRTWSLLQPFLPTSPQQVLAYIKHKGYPLQRNRKTKKLTTDLEALHEILRRFPSDPVLPLVIEAKQFNKAAGYLADTFLGRDGRLHPRYTFLPKTGRLSAKAPNVMNQPQGRRGAVLAMVAEKIRSSFLPTPGYILLEFDWRAVEALLTSFFANDPDYFRIAKMGGSYTYPMSHGLAAEGKIPSPADLAWDDVKLGKFLADLKKQFPVAYADFKKAVLADTYGQGVYNMARDLRCTVPRAVWLKKIIASASPKVAKWKEETQLRAHLEGQLTNPFGYNLAFFEVFKWAEGKWVPGREANETLAFLPQSTCAAMLRDCLVTLGAHPEEGTLFRLLMSIHDAIVVEARLEAVERVVELVRSVMERPWAELNGLRAEVEIKIGWTMSSMEKWQGIIPLVPEAGPSGVSPVEMVVY